MAKSKESSEKPIEARISDWLDTQGYPLEMAVAAAFREAGFQVTISDFFVDPDSGKHREIDVVAWMDEYTGEGDFRVSIQVECKSSHDHPWIAFIEGAQTVLDERFQYLFTIASPLGRQFINAIRREPQGRDKEIFQRTERPAYGVTQAFTSGQDVVYAALSGVLAASRARVIAASEQSKEWPQVEIIFPLVVTNARLFQNYLDSKGNRVLDERVELLLVWRKPQPGQGATIVPIVSAAGLPQFAQRMATICTKLKDGFPEQMSSVMDRWHKTSEAQQS